MASKRKHHFVPRFYLRGFASAPKRIHLYNFDNDILRADISLNKQCQKNHFYGSDNVVENALAEIEGNIAPVIASIRENHELPDLRSEGHHLLILFVAFQLVRTTGTADKINEFIDLVGKKIALYFSDLSNKDLEAVRISLENPVYISMSCVDDMAEGIEDLKMQLVCCSNEQRFFTSDDPTFRYNTFCEDIQEAGKVGVLCHGLQIFLPISPTALLILYDENIYKVGDGRFSVLENITDKDVATLNRLQAISANQNMYFSDWSCRDQVEESYRNAKRLREKMQVHANEFCGVGGEEETESSLIHIYDLLPNLELDLSFVDFRRKAVRMSDSDRVNSYRKEMNQTVSDFHSPHLAEKERVFRRAG